MIQNRIRQIDKEYHKLTSNSELWDIYVYYGRLINKESVFYVSMDEWMDYLLNDKNWVNKKVQQLKIMHEFVSDYDTLINFGYV